MNGFIGSRKECWSAKKLRRRFLPTLRTAIGVNSVDVVAAAYLSRCSLERKRMTTESHEPFFGAH
jgi:hypothetical protein